MTDWKQDPNSGDFRLVREDDGLAIDGKDVGIDGLVLVPIIDPARSHLGEYRVSFDACLNECKVTTSQKLERELIRAGAKFSQFSDDDDAKVGKAIDLGEVAAEHLETVRARSLAIVRKAVAEGWALENED